MPRHTRQKSDAGSNWLTGAVYGTLLLGGLAIGVYSCSNSSESESNKNETSLSEICPNLKGIYIDNNIEISGEVDQFYQQININCGSCHYDGKPAVISPEVTPEVPSKKTVTPQQIEDIVNTVTNNSTKSQDTIIPGVPGVDSTYNKPDTCCINYNHRGN